VNIDEGANGWSTCATIPRLHSTCSMKATGTPTSASSATSTWHEDTDLADIDRLARRYTGDPYRQRDRGRISTWIAVEGLHGWGALKDSSSQPG
jgi:hypothetical protein